MPDPLPWIDHLRACAVPPAVLESFIAGDGWARFDPELGYVLGNSAIDWGHAGTRAYESVDRTGARTATRYHGAVPRIASYGDGIVEAIQLGDGETWQEFLAGRLREPVANFGVGGYGVYQAYRRMRRHEGRLLAGGVVILAVDAAASIRSPLRARWATLHPGGWEVLHASAFHGGFWPHLILDPESGETVERENLLPTVPRLTAMSDPEAVVELLHDDVAAQLTAYADGIVADLDVVAADRLAEALEIPVRTRSRSPRLDARRLLTAYGSHVTDVVIRKAADLVSGRGARLLLAVDIGRGPTGPDAMERAATTRVAATAAELGIPLVDLHELHAREQSELGVSRTRLMRRYFDGFDGVPRQNPFAQLFLAHALAPRVAELLDPPPAPYDTRAARPRTVEERPQPSREETELEPVLRVLRERLDEEWDVAAVGRLARCSRSALYRRFVEGLGMAPMAYLRSLRVQEAARRLRTTSDTITAIAHSVGFAGGPHLSREFARRYGIPPSRYRRDADPAAFSL